MGLVVFQTACFLRAVRYEGEHDVEQLIVLVTMVLNCCLVFPFPSTLGIEIFEVLLWKRRLSFETWVFLKACKGEFRVPSALLI